jgi:hypothetical protein
MARTISDEAVKAAYATAKRVHEGTLSRAAGVKDLHQRFSVNPSSAADMIDNVSHMIRGEQYERTNNKYATDYFLRMIHRDFGLDALKNAIAAVAQHLAYYEALPNGSKQPATRAILANYRELARQEAELNSGKGLTPEQQESFTRLGRLLQQRGEFDPNDEEDARERTVAAVVRRQGQPAFRSLLLKLYRGRCAVSGCDIEAVLEAAHITPYKGPRTNHPSNGLLLRADLHTLFDLGLLAVDTQTMKSLVAREVQGSCYGEYAGKPLAIPENLKGHPSRNALDEHRRKSKHFGSASVFDSGATKQARTQPSTS